MTDDLKQRADAAWEVYERCDEGSVSWREMLKLERAAVEASIAAALAPVVERVARLEGRITDSGVVIPKPPPAEAKCEKCPMCGGPKAGNGWICGRPDWKGWAKDDRFGERGCSGPDCTDRYRRPCPNCTKSEARQAMCIRHDAPYPCVQCGDLAAPASSAQKAPERVVRYWEDHGFLWETEQRIGAVRVEYVRADVHTRECSTQRLIGLKESEGIHAKTVALLTAANARVEELEKLQLRMEDVASSAYDAARAEGRADGIREAAGIYERWALAGVVSMSPRGVMNDILALLDKPGEK